MACLITQGRKVACKEFIGGLYKVWFINYNTFTPTINASNILTSLSGATVYEYELKGSSQLTQEMTSNADLGITFVRQTLVLDLQGGDYNFNNEIKLLAYGRPHAIVQDNYGSAWYVGRFRGLDLQTAVHQTGAALGEKYGYTVTMVANENEYANWLSGSTITNAFAGMTIAPTIVVGS